MIFDYGTITLFGIPFQGILSNHQFCNFFQHQAHNKLCARFWNTSLYQLPLEISKYRYIE